MIVIKKHKNEDKMKVCKQKYQNVKYYARMLYVKIQVKCSA
jgi:hypothetical protein